MTFLPLFSLLYAALFLLGYFITFRKIPQGELDTIKGRSPYYGGLLGLLALAVIQLSVTGFMPGHIQDTGLFRAWAAFAHNQPVWAYYTTELYVDYPPVYLYVLYLIGKVTQLLGIAPESPVFIVFVRSVPILFDGITSFCIFKMSRNMIGDKKALALAFFSAVNPVNILNSTFWGQIDSVTAFMTAAMLWMLYQKRHVAACSIMAVLFLTKPQMIIFTPLLGFVFFFDLVEAWQDPAERKQMLKKVAFSVLAMAAIFLIVPFPITGGNYMLLLENYKKALNLYPYASLNAANLYGALGANWAPDGARLLFFSFKTWGFIFIVAISLIVGYVSFRSADRKKIFWLGAFTVLGIYMLAHGMHERYMQPMFLLLLFIYVLSGDKKQLLFYGAFSITTFLGCGQVLLLNQQNDFVYGNNMFFILLSLIHVVLFIMWLIHGVRFNKNSMKPLHYGRGGEKTIFVKEEKSSKLTRLDCWLMLGLTVFYALFGFYRLGSNNVPESGWYVEKARESVVLDMGEVQDLRQIYIYTGWIDRRQSDQDVCRDLTLEYSADGENWTRVPAPFQLNSVFKWHVFRNFAEPCQFVRLICDDGRFYVNEIALFGETESDRHSFVVTETKNETAQAVLDEPDRVTYEFSWYEGAYFDEIYHPRTAYEYITHRYPYENTHPPLGKIFIACGMLLFGVNPFGWRFFGTLCGVFMVPLVYLMGKKMLKQSRYAFMAAFVFSFDFMHLSQTRLATIDSYTAFFVMGMYLFMFLYIEKNFYETDLKKTLWPLLASGICFGLGAATKWQGIYGGFGLAVLYFYNLFCRYSEYKKALRHPKEKGAAHIIESFPSLARKTILAGFGFFVVIPGVIYFLSYIPAMMTESTGLSFFFTNQTSMYNYHAGLEATHSYGSSWWQWPLDYKPLYAYSPNRDFVPMGTSMGISSFGNPAVWWLTIPMVIWGVCQIFRKRKQVDLGLLTAIVGFFSLYAPWILVTRTAFIYHFFPCVVFVVLLLMFFLRERKGVAWRRVEWVYLGLVLVLFLAFYPVLTGMAVPSWYASFLRWIPGWVLG